MKRLITFLIILSCCSISSWAQQNIVHSKQIRTLQTIVDNDPLLPPILQMGKFQHIEISWDEMSHEYHRYIYHIQHCEADWTPSEGIFESDFLQGHNDQPVEDYETSFNTIQLYTHYSISFPNKETSLRMSGNYRVLFYEEGEDIDNPVLEACFCVSEKNASIRTEISSNTDIDFNDAHQQLTLGVDFGTLSVVNPEQEFHMVVLQNRFWEGRVENPQYNMRKSNGIEFTHNRDLIFPAGNEFHKFEILDINRTAMGVDRMEWFEPYHHATLFAQKPPHNYDYDEDQNGVYVLRSSDDEDDATTAEYILVHFTLDTPRLQGGDVYVCGQWTNGTFDPECRMEYDELNHCYEKAVLLKQGYYEYQFVQEDGGRARTMGDFHETENEYLILLYHRAQGERTDRLVNYSIVHNE